MNIIQITPGAGQMICGACLRDSALAVGLRGLGHSVLIVPLYLPLALEEEDQLIQSPIFFSGVNVFLEQKLAFFRKTPRWMHRMLASPRLLTWAARSAAKIQPQEVGDTTLSMLRGEQGNQAREVEELIAWLKPQKPDLISLSNVLLVGLVRRLKNELKVPVVCSLQGEDSFLDALPADVREKAWQVIAERAGEIDMFIAPSKYFGCLMSRRLDLSPGRVRTVYNGINLRGFDPPASTRSDPPVLGFFARMCREKGLDSLVQAFIAIKERGRVKNLRLRAGGYCSPSDKKFVNRLQAQLKKHGALADTEFCPNLTRSQKQAFLRSLTVFSVPAAYSEAFGLYVIEALAAGAPVVQPAQSAFPELIDATHGGVLFEPGNVEAMAAAFESLLLDPAKARALGDAGRAAVFEKFSVEAMARQIAHICEMLVKRKP